MTNILPERTATPGEHADHSAWIARTRALGVVRRKRCPQCGAPGYGPCQTRPPADHLARWLSAYAGGRISRVDLIGAISGLVVISASQLVQERAA